MVGMLSIGPYPAGASPLSPQVRPILKPAMKSYSHLLLPDLLSVPLVFLLNSYIFLLHLSTPKES